jgi:Zn2+/Cd2+-exporting ATPase
MKQSIFYIAKMDCPTEEQLIRNRLKSVEGIDRLDFNLMQRELTVTHRLDDERSIQSSLDSLGLGAKLKTPEAPADGVKQALFYVAGMCCATEEQLIRNRLKSMPEIERLDFNTMQRELTVTHRLDDEQSIVSALDSLGMEPQLRSSTDAEAITTDEAHGNPATVPMATRVLMGISGLTAVAAEATAWAIRNENSLPVIALALISIAAGGRDTLGKGLIAVRTFTLNINFLMSLAIVGAMLIGQWPEAAMVTFLFGIAEMVEELSLDRARNAIRGLMEMTPEAATVQDEQGQWREVPAGTVQVGQIVRVRPGERIPLDGTVTAGQSAVNQAPITGESIPVEKKVGDQVFAGTINERGSFEFRVTSDKGHTTLDRIIRAVQEAQGQRAPTQRVVDRLARYYTPTVVGLAVLVAAVPPILFGAAFQPWLYKALVMLVIACPCALVISTPVTVVSGLAAAARLGILVKGGVYLEEGRRLRAVALDKTGTLTHGKPVVTDVVPLNGQSVDTVLQIAASLDAHSEHPVASAIVAKWTGANQSTPAPSNLIRLDAVRRSGELLFVSHFESITGRGVAGSIGGRRYFVGNHRLAEENKVCGPQVEAELERVEREGKTAVVLMTDQEPLAVLGVADTLRDTSIEAVKSLHDLGVRTVMLTGDNQTTAQAIAARVGIDDARGNLLPEDKLTAMEELLKKHVEVGMVGDGINDAPALAKASIGFAMGAAGTDTALETADVALMEDDLRKLPLFIALSRQTSRILAQNITLAIGIKVVFFVLALAGKATLWMAVFADMGGSLLVVFNGLRVLRSNQKLSQPPSTGRKM